MSLTSPLSLCTGVLLLLETDFQPRINSWGSGSCLPFPGALQAPLLSQVMLGAQYLNQSPLPRPERGAAHLPELLCAVTAACLQHRQKFLCLAVYLVSPSPNPGASQPLKLIS